MLDPQNALVLWNKNLAALSWIYESPGLVYVLGVDSFQNSPRDTDDFFEIFLLGIWSHIAMNEQKKCMETRLLKSFAVCVEFEHWVWRSQDTWVIWKESVEQLFDLVVWMSHKSLLSFILSLLFKLTFLIKVKW